MTVCLVIIAIVLAQAGVGQEGHVNEPWVAWFVLVFVCIYIAAYAWSCKPLAPLCLVVPALEAKVAGSLWDVVISFIGIDQHAFACASVCQFHNFRLLDVPGSSSLASFSCISSLPNLILETCSL